MIELERVFPELTPEVDYSAQMYAKGKEIKEVAIIKCRAIATINNQIQKAFEILDVRNRSELTIKYCERITKTIISIFFLSLIFTEMVNDTTNIYRGNKRIEVVGKNRRKRNEYEPLILPA